MPLSTLPSDTDTNTHTDTLDGSVAHLPIEAQMAHAIKKNLDGAKITVDNRGGGHFAVTVVWQGFAGKNTLMKHRAVLGAIKHLMSGADAPVHAVDQIDARTE